MVVLCLTQGGLTFNGRVVSDPGRPVRLMIVLCLTQGGLTFNGRVVSDPMRPYV